MSGTPPVVEWHFIDAEKNMVELTMFSIPKEERRRGVGRSTYESWEASLPLSVKVIRLFAADTDGNGNSDCFWERMGFDWRYTADDISDMDYTTQHSMHKGIHGHPTPEPVFVDACEE